MASPEAVIGNAPDTPGVTEYADRCRTRPAPNTSSGASTTFGVTTSGIRTVRAGPLPGEEATGRLVELRAACWSKVTRKVLVSPFALNDRIDGLTDTLTPGMLAVAR